MISFYLIFSILLLFIGRISSLLYFVALIPFTLFSLDLFLYHDLNTNIQGYLSVIQDASFFAYSGSMEPSYSILISFLKIFSDSPSWIYLSTILLSLFLIAFSYRRILSLYFKSTLYLPLATVLCAYLPIVFIFQARSGLALSFLFLSISFVGRPILFVLSYVAAVSFHVQSIPFILIYPIFWNLNNIIFYKFSIPRLVKSKYIIFIVCAIPLIFFALYIFLSSTFFSNFIMSQGLRYLNNPKYDGFRITGFLILLVSSPLAVSIRNELQKSISNSFFIPLYKRLFIASYISALLTNIVFCSNLHLATRFSRPFEFILLIFSIHHLSSRFKSSLGQLVFASFSFLLLYFSWSLKYIL